MRLNKACRCLYLYITLSTLLFLLLQLCPCLQWHQRATMPSLLMPTPPTQSALNQSKNSPRPALQPATTARLWVRVYIPGCILWEIGLLIYTSVIARVDYKLLCYMLPFGAVSSLYANLQVDAQCNNTAVVPPDLNICVSNTVSVIFRYVGKFYKTLFCIDFNKGKITGVQNTCLFCYLSIQIYFCLFIFLCIVFVHT